MDRIVRKFSSFQEAEAEDIAYDRSLTPEQRVALVLELRAMAYPDLVEQRMARVYRVVGGEQG